MQDIRPIHKTMNELCNELVAKKWIVTKEVLDVMLQVDRGDFAPSNPYENNPQNISFNVVISAPLLHAYCLEKMKDYLVEGSRALDIGFGSGYLTVAMSLLMGRKGHVIGIEHIKGLCEFGYRNIKKHHADLIQNKNIILICGDGRLGYKQCAPYKCIHVGAAALEPPRILIEQLSLGGRLIMPLGPQGDQYIYTIDKDLSGKISINRGLSVRYVPLTSIGSQLGNRV